MRLRSIFVSWLPLAVSFELMMLEGPAVQGAMGRLPDAPRNLAAWGLTLSLSLLIESPVIMLLATAIALVRDRDSYQALRRFMITLCLICTGLTFVVAFTPLFDSIAGDLMGQPAPIVAAARPAMRIMLFWTAAIAWRRFYQGILVRHGQTRLVSWGTALRLLAAVGVAAALVEQGGLPGAQVASWAIMAAVGTEALATTWFARRTVRGELPPRAGKDEAPLTQRAIWRFHTPLAATTLLTLLAQPLTSAALARLPAPGKTLAAWPVVFLLLLVMRGWGMALQEITVAQARDPDSGPAALRAFTWLVGGATSLVTMLIALTPLLPWYLDAVIHLPADLHPYVLTGVGAGLLLPLVTALGSWARGLLVAAGMPGVVYRGMGWNLAVHTGLLALGVRLQLPGMWVAVGAFLLAAVVEYLYLARRVAPLSVSVPAR